MIYLTRLNGEKLAVNVELIEFLQETPDTIVTLTTGRKLVVKESIKNIQKQIIMFRKACFTTLKP